MLKRILSTGLACVMCAMLATTAFAAGGDYDKDGNFKVGGGYTEGGMRVSDMENTAPTNTATDGKVYVEGINHTVVAGDTLGHLSVNYFGNYNYHKVLYDVNDDVFAKSGGMMVPGMVLFIPDAIGTAQHYDWPIAGEDEVLYTVKGGETLGIIGQAQYPNIINAAELIYERNDDRLVNVHSIYEGQVLVLPVIEYTEVTNTAPSGGGNSALGPGMEG